MKKFTKILLCMLLCAFGFGVLACDRRTEKEKAFTYPNSKDIVTGNGGLAVQKGNYLYFVNGTKAVSSDEHKQNGSYEHGALMLMKLDDLGNIVTDEDEILKDENYIVLSNKLAGFDATSLFISGDYIYFTTPCQRNVYTSGNNKEWAKERVTFWRMKLDKSASAEEVYESTIGYENLEFEYFACGNNVYAMVYEDGENLEDSEKSNTLFRVQLAKNGSVKQVATGLKDYQCTSNGVFYVEQDTNYIMKKYDVASDNSTVVTTNANSIEISAVGKENIFVNIKTNSTNQLKKFNIASNQFVANVYTTSGTMPEMFVTQSNDTLFFVSDNKIKFLVADSLENWQVSANKIVDEDATSIDIIGVVNGCIVYCDDSSNVKIVSYSNCLNSNGYSIKTLTTLDDTDVEFDISYDDEYLYFINAVGSHNYLYRLKVVGNTGETEELVGKLLSSDIPTEDEE